MLFGFSNRLNDAAPDVAKFLGNIQMETQIASDWAFELVEKGRDADEVAREWVDNNQDLVNSWLGL